MVWANSKLVEIIKKGGIAVMPTDTLYGIVGDALNSKTVENIYAARKRNSEKPCIILISDIDELKKFGIALSGEQKEEINKNEVPTSFILDCPLEKFEYLHRGTKTLAFRIPKNLDLQKLLEKTGPLIAPSANLEGESHAKNVSEAKNYFGDLVDLYVDGGEISGKASKVIKLYNDGSVIVVRP